MLRARRKGAALALALVLAAGAGCASVLGIDKDYEQVGPGLDGSEAGVGPDAAESPDAGEDGASGDTDSGDGSGDGGASDAPFDGTPYAALATSDLRLYYARSVGDLWYRTWTHTTKTWAPAVMIAQLNPTRVPWVKPAIGPGGVELVATLPVDTTNGGSVETFTGAPGWPAGFTASNVIPTARSTRRGFDVVFGASTGNPIVVYADGTGIPKYRRRVGTTWSAETAVLSTAPGAAVNWIRLAAHPSTDEATLVFSDTSQHLFAAVWNGSTWSTATTLDSTGPSADAGLGNGDFLAFAAAYENVSGDALVFWSRPSSCGGQNDPVIFTTKTQGTSTFATPQATTLKVGSAGVYAVASEPGTDRIAFAIEEFADCTLPTGAANDFNAGIWDGSQWTAFTDLNGNMGAPSYVSHPGVFPMAVGWIAGKAVTVWAQQPSTDLNWATWSGAASWVLQTPATMTPPLAQQLNFEMVKTSDALVLLFEDANGSVWGKSFDGASWSDMNAGNSIADNLRTSDGKPMGVVVR